ncbi:recombinase family protein [Flavobacterium supellecticarium]|uniref:Recombinase family protein n=1 Tax=Flavobacterium supellecticarium TaxID=2565924 RepID=A0A4S3ZTY9_9FLAO|nr:recombinase family protein [Flavobacterium supellecticarium]THF49164.1 recombinase family protein [Flavobacterium supellecticarium]
MKAIGYMRLSSKDQSRYSLDVQEAAINAYCAKYGLELIALFKDNGQRSSTFSRLDFQALEIFIKRYKGLVQYMVVMEHDRFSRDLSEALLKIKKFESQYGVKVVSVDEPLDIDPTDPTVFISRAFRYATANAELLNIRARTIRGIKRAHLEGRFVNKAPYGYSNSRDLLGKGILVVNNQEAEIVQQIFRYYLSGMSLREITTIMNREGFPLKGHNAVTRILDNTLYAGLIKVIDEDGKVKYVKALHERIVSEADYWLVQEIRNRKKPSKLKLDKDYLLKGLLKCSCGKYMTAGWSKGKSRYYLYYRCISHISVNIPGKRIHEQFRLVLEHLKLTKEQLILLNKKAAVRIDKLLKDEKQQIRGRQKMLQELDAKMESLEEHLIEGTLNKITFKKWSEQYNAEHSRVRDIIKATEEYIANQLQLMKKYMSGIHTVQDIIACQNDEPLARQMILKFVFRYGLQYEDDRLRTYKICPALSHNCIELTNRGLLRVDEVETATKADHEHFLNFITEQLVHLSSDY